MSSVCLSVLIQIFHIFDPPTNKTPPPRIHPSSTPTLHPLIRLDRFIARVNSLLDLTRTTLSFSRLAKARTTLLFVLAGWMDEWMTVCMHVHA